MGQKRQKESARDMNKESEFSFERARRVTPEESQKLREAISEQFGIKIKNEDEKYEPISICIFWNDLCIIQ